MSEQNLKSKRTASFCQIHDQQGDPDDVVGRNIKMRSATSQPIGCLSVPEISLFNASVKYKHALKKDCRKQGVRRLLLAKAEEVARYENMQEMQLEVDRANTAAITFYNSHGYMPNGKETEQSIYLRKQLV